MDGERSNSDVMTLGQAGRKQWAKPAWTVGLVENPPTEGPKYAIEGAGQAGTYLYNRVYNDGDQLFWIGRPNKFMRPLNKEAQVAVKRYELEQLVKQKRRDLQEMIGKTPGIKTKQQEALAAEIDLLDKQLDEIPEMAPPVAKPKRMARNNEV